MSESRLEIALLHRVEPPRPQAIGPDADASLAPERLERYLESRSGWSRLVPDQLMGGQCPPLDGRGAFMLTFDDGHRSIAEWALPILEKHEVGALVFVTTGFAAGELAAYETTLADLVAGHDRLVRPDDEPLILETHQQKLDAYRQLRLPLKQFAPDERESRVRELLTANGVDADRAVRDEHLDWEALGELDRHPLITLGAHSHGHALLTALPWKQAWHEIRHSRLELERRLGHEIPGFAYPYGGVGRAVRQFVRMAGFRYAFTTEPRRPIPGEPLDRFALPRSELTALLDDAEADLAQA